MGRTLATTVLIAAALLVSGPAAAVASDTPRPVRAAAAPTTAQPLAWYYHDTYNGWEECVAVGQHGVNAGYWADYECVEWIDPTGISGWDLYVEI